MENRPEFVEVAWAAQRSGLYYTAINWHLSAEEVEYILGDCGAGVLVTSVAQAGTLAALAGRMAHVEVVLAADGELPQSTHGWSDLSGFDDGDLDDPAEGCELLYSSGTTGRPKAVKRPLPREGELVANHAGALAMYRTTYATSEDSVYLSPAPLYHSAPLMSCMTIHRIGATVVVMERFDAETCLALVDRHRVTHGLDRCSSAWRSPRRTEHRRGADPRRRRLPPAPPPRQRPAAARATRPPAVRTG